MIRKIDENELSDIASLFDIINRDWQDNPIDAKMWVDRNPLFSLLIVKRLNDIQEHMTFEEALEDIASDLLYSYSWIHELPE